MVSTGAIRAGKAFVEIGGDDSALKRALKSVQQQLAKFGAAVRNVGLGLGAIGSAITAPLALAVHSFAESGSALNDLSARTGIAVETLSELAYAAQQTGADLGTVETGVRKMQRTIVEAANGSKSAADALAALGLSASELISLSPDRQFDLVAQRIAEIQDPAKRTAAAVELLGRSGTALIPMILELDTLRQKARALGLVMTTEDAAAADRLGDALDTLKASFGAVQNAIGAALAGPLSAFAESLARVAANVIAFLRAHREAIVVVATLGVGLTVAGGALAAFGAALTVIGPALSVVGAIIAGLVSPLTLVGGAILALAGWFAYSAAAGQSFGEKMQSIGNFVLDVFTAVAFTALNWRDTLNIAFLSAILGIVRFGNEVAYWFGTVVPTWLGYLIFNWRDTFQTIWDYTRTVITNLYDNLVEFFAAVINWLQGDEFKFEWKGLTEGFQSSLRDLPVIAERELGALEGALGSELDDLNKTMDGKFDEFRERFRAKLGELKAKFGQLTTPPVPVPGAPHFEMPDLAGVVEKMKTTVAGTFSSEALSQLGASAQPVEEVARNTRPLADIRDGIKELNRNVRNNGLAFS